MNLHSNNELQALVKTYFSTKNGARQPALRRRIIEIIHTEVPLIPVVWYDQIAAINTRVTGFVNDPYEQRLRLNEVSIRR